MKVLIAHPGTQYSHYLVKQLEKHDLLYRFYTGFAISKNGLFYKILSLLPGLVLKMLGNRFIESVSPKKIKNTVWIEWSALLQLRLGNDAEAVFYKRNKRFQEQIPDAAILACDVVIGFDTSSWILAERCKQLRKRFILDVSIGHPRSKELVYDVLKKKYPNWREHIQSKSKHLIDLEESEMLLADTLVVPSSFVKKTYTDHGIPENKININPFGTSIVSGIRNSSQKVVDEKIKFLFFGALTARKGLPLLLEAWESINTDNAVLTIAGYGKMPDSISLPRNIVNKGVVLKEEIRSLYESHHVFVFPSNFEGFAQVQIEAATFGLPIIGTFNSGVTELVEDGISGFIITPNDLPALVSAMKYFIENPTHISKMSKLIKMKGDQFSWDAYGERWVNILKREFKN